MTHNKKGTDILVEALEYYYDYIAKKPISPNTKRQSEYNLGHYLEYIKEQGISDDIKILTQEALNNYKKYLQDNSRNLENGKRALSGSWYDLIAGISPEDRETFMTTMNQKLAQDILKKYMTGFEKIF